MEWEVGKRDIWERGGPRIAELVCADWKKAAALMAAAPDLYAALSDMLLAFESARDPKIATQMLNDRRCTAARLALAKAQGKST